MVELKHLIEKYTSNPMSRFTGGRYFNFEVENEPDVEKRQIKMIAHHLAHAFSISEFEELEITPPKNISDISSTKDYFMREAEKLWKRIFSENEKVLVPKTLLDEALK